MRISKEVRFDPCSIEGCVATGLLYDIRRQLCKTHYMRLHDHDLLPPKPTVIELLVRWRRVTESGCWEWRGSISPEGYGRYANDYVHRVSWELQNGPIPEGLDIDHLCRNRICFRPEHLEPVTHKINVQRGAASFILTTGQCKAGHEMTPRNTYLYELPNRTRRICRACKREAWRRDNPDRPRRVA